MTTPLLIQKIRCSFSVLYLQLLDLLTTVLAILNGGAEANPLISWSIHLHGVYGLVAAKAVVAVLALYCAWSGRQRLLQRVTWLYAVIVVWNVLVAIGGTLARH